MLRKHNGQADAAGRTDAALDPKDWRSRVLFEGQSGPADVPEWLEPCYVSMREKVMDAGYPCFFGTMAEKRGEMFYSYVRGKDLGSLPATMETFARLSVLPEYQKNNIAIFFEPDATPLAHDTYREHFWKVLQHLHDHDIHPDVARQPAPEDADWEFSFAGLQMFVVCACPSFTVRHSRNLGPGMVLLFQPRSVFVDKVTNRVIGQQARDEVRRRLQTWDELGAHPDLGFFGDPGNREWKQYFLPDSNDPASERCPFLSRAKRERERQQEREHEHANT
ncbi:YqcI/YcgG family protein [Bordetella sp. N]|uniref:YqcI/YcgG family protein n=1 Tax=Bordetella sp. N TaxID=1746199 RepID=UPI0007108DEF|nr:YqcI/YcgG family protein [Bordetella sp. N]ALM82671.1 hypothetical protein ASB57_06625 [Bordetella sp. N]